MLQASITLLATDQGYKISGVVNLDNLSSLEKQLDALSTPSAWQVDCGQITYANSALIAMLLKLQRQALNHQQTLTLTNLPDGTKNIINAYGLTSILLNK